MALVITSRINSDLVILDLSGKLRVLESSLARTVQELLVMRHRTFVLNLEKVCYVDCFGLGQLIKVLTAIEREGGQMALLRPGYRLLELFRVTCLDAVFRIVDEEFLATE